MRCSCRAAARLCVKFGAGASRTRLAAGPAIGDTPRLGGIGQVMSRLSQNRSTPMDAARIELAKAPCAHNYRAHWPTPSKAEKQNQDHHALDGETQRADG